MDRNITVRLYKRGDADGINSMFMKYLPYLRDRAFWVWINRIMGESISVVAEYQGKIVGHYAIVPRVINFNGQEIKSALSIHAFVAPEYRNKIFIFEITSALYRIAKDRGIQLIYGFPNVNYRNIQLKIERWKEVALFKSYELNSSKVILPASINIQLAKVKGIDYNQLFQLSELFTELQFGNAVVPSNGITNWINRYFLHPQESYTVYALSKKGDIIGYIVSKLYKNEGRCYSHILDYVVSKTSDMKEVISAFLYTEKDNCDIFSVWQGDSSFRNSLLTLGFEQTGFETFLGVKVLDKSIADIEQLLDFNNWRLVMGDSDVF